MHVTARADYAVRAVLELAARLPASATRQELAQAQDIPGKFLEAILRDLRRAGIVDSLRGSAGGYRLAREPSDVHLGEVIRAIEGPLAAVRGRAPEDIEYHGPAESLREVWVAVRASLRDVLDATTVADVIDGTLPNHLTKLLEQPESWSRR